MTTRLFISDEVSEKYPPRKQDRIVLQRSLERLGSRSRPIRALAPWPDKILLSDLRSVQDSLGLKADGVAKPDGPTVRAIGKVLERSANHFHLPAIERSIPTIPVFTSLIPTKRSRRRRVGCAWWAVCRRSITCWVPRSSSSWGGRRPVYTCCSERLSAC